MTSIQHNALQHTSLASAMIAVQSLVNQGHTSKKGKQSYSSNETSFTKKAKSYKHIRSMKREWREE